LEADPTGRRLRIYYSDKGGREEGGRRVIVKIDAVWTISVKGSRPDLIEWDDLDLIPVQEVTTEGTQSRENMRV
jgi:hypothetical protein